MLFATEEWAQAFRDKVEGSAAYRKAGAGWTHGPIVLAVRAAPALGLPAPVGLWLDLSGGHCREAKLVTMPEAARAPFCIEGNYADWKAVTQRRLDPIKAILTRKLSLRGSKLTLLRYVPAALALVDCALQVPVEFADDVKDRT
ncbi:MAG: SCP2 sterol-binding domain-containing protein [Polyangia bacterium]